MQKDFVKTVAIRPRYNVSKNLFATSGLKYCDPDEERIIPLWRRRKNFSEVFSRFWRASRTGYIERA